MKTIGLISPGEMGSSIGAAALYSDNRVIWAGSGRSDASRKRAESARLEDCGTIQEMMSEAEIILSVCPPHDAESVAAVIGTANFDGLFVDCNAIAPQKCRQISANFQTGHFIDGGIVGGPAWKAESGTMLYLSGSNALAVADLFSESPLHTTIISEEIGAASTMKMVFAAYTKGSTALLAAILGVAEKGGVRDVLERQWGEQFTRQTHQRLVGNSTKAWRFSGEMLEIAATFDAAGFSGGFHEAAANTFDRLAGFKDNKAEDIESLLSELLRSDVPD